jgi:hypothetical protein
MKPELLDAEAELSIAAANLQQDPPDVASAQAHIEAARSLLLELAEGCELVCN